MCMYAYACVRISNCFLLWLTLNSPIVHPADDARFPNVIVLKFLNDRRGFNIYA